MTRFGIVTTLLCAFALNQSASAQWDFSGELGFELRMFPEDPAYAGQDDATFSPSISFQPEIVYEWDEGSERATFEPFLRWDAHDNHRTHADIREASYLHLADSWDLTIGISRVFWGVTESVHLVDVINQTDGVEDIDNEDKLGQQMVNVNWLTNTGTYSLFVLPGFRERTFPGDDARRRGPFEIEQYDTLYESGAEENHVDVAGRWAHSLGNWDLGLSTFYGTNREARLIGEVAPSGDIHLRPYYELMFQTGIDVQYTREAWLWKLESLYRDGENDSYIAAVGGFEYTLYQIFESNADLGLLMEYQYDDRNDDGSTPLTVADNDLFVAARYALNDESSTALLAGLIYDLHEHTILGLIEAERRLSNNWKIEVEGRFVTNADVDDPAYFFRRDDSLTLRLTYAF
ncbi:MAG: hypothetical protein VCD00_19690 [Candidatus Hydrogenedentota bacterium]